MSYQDSKTTQCSQADEREYLHPEIDRQPQELFDWPTNSTLGRWSRAKRDADAIAVACGDDVLDYKLSGCQPVLTLKDQRFIVGKVHRCHTRTCPVDAYAQKLRYAQEGDYIASLTEQEGGPVLSRCLFATYVPIGLDWQPLQRVLALLRNARPFRRHVVGGLIGRHLSMGFLWHAHLLIELDKRAASELKRDPDTNQLSGPWLDALRAHLHKETTNHGGHVHAFHVEPCASFATAWVYASLQTSAIYLDDYADFPAFTQELKGKRTRSLVGRFKDLREEAQNQEREPLPDVAAEQFRWSREEGEYDYA